MKTFIFEADFEQDEEDGRWSAVVPVLPGCAVWGYTLDEALHHLRIATRMYVEDMLECGERVPGSGIISPHATLITFVI